QTLRISGYVDCFSDRNILAFAQRQWFCRYAINFNQGQVIGRVISHIDGSKWMSRLLTTEFDRSLCAALDDVPVSCDQVLADEKAAAKIRGGPIITVNRDEDDTR